MKRLKEFLWAVGREFGWFVPALGVVALALLLVFSFGGCD